MSKVFIYYPFDDWLFDTVIANTEEFMRNVDKTFEFSVIYVGDGLAAVGDDDLVCVNAHGNIEKPDEMYLKSPLGNETKTANDIADQMVSEGLPRTHQSILLLNCWGGGSSELRPGAAPGTDLVTAPSDLVVTKNGYLACLASVFAKALGLRSYSSILVGGFPGVVVDAIRNKGTTFVAGEAQIRAQIDHIQWFDARGQNTSVRTAAGPGSSSFAGMRQQLGSKLYQRSRPTAAPPRPRTPWVPQRPIGGFRPVNK
jgi:hypothetical protein